jgi:hypothetical protein
MFRKESDFEEFKRVMVEAHLRQPIRILSYCVLSLAGGTAGELDGSRQRSVDHEGTRPLRVSIERGRPYGEEKRVRQTEKISGWSRPFVRKAAHGKRANRRPRRQAHYADSIQRSDS